MNLDRYIPILKYDEIENFVLAALNIHIDLLKSMSRKKEIVLARKYISYFCLELTDLSQKKIGEFISKGDRKYDHSTVHYGWKRIKELIDNDKQTRFQVESIFINILKFVEYKKSLKRLAYLCDMEINYGNDYGDEIKGLSDKVYNYEQIHYPI